MSDFCRARFARIYPLYFIVIVASALLAASGGVLSALVWDLSPSDLAAHAALIGGKGIFWTISVEFQFYGLFALFWILCRGWLRLENNVLALILALACALVVLAGMPGDRISIFRNLQFFIFGALGALAVQSVSRERLVRIANAALPFAALAYLCLWPLVMFRMGENQDAYYRFVPIGLVAGFLVLFAAAAKSGFVVRWLGTKPMVALGEWSFGVYLLHIPVIRAAAILAAVLHIPTFWMGLPVLLIVTALARLSYRVIETPIRLALTRDRIVAVPREA